MDRNRRMDLPAQGKSLALAILILGMGLAAPGTAFGLSELGYYRLGTREGLAGDTVYAILQDERGQMWFGSTGGISRFDGHSFATYRPRFDGRSFASSRVLSLVQDRLGLIWIGTDGGGVSSFDPDTGSFVNFGSERGLRGDRIGALGLDGLGRLVAGSAEGYIDRYDQAAGGFLPFCEREGAARISGILRDSRGRIWVATKGEGLERYSDEGFREAVYRHEAKIPSSISSDAVSAIFEDSFGGLWTGTEEGGVDLFREGRFSHAGKSPKALPVRSLAEDPEGRLWIGYQDGGFDLLDPSSMLPIAGQPKENTSVLAMRRDSGGLVWAGTENEGLRVYNLRSSLFRRMARRNSAGKAAGVTGFALLRNGGALASTDSMGIVRPDPVSGSLLLESGFPGLAAGIVSATGPLLESTDGSLYCGTSGGLFALSADGSSRIFRHDPGSAGAIAGDSVLSLCEDGKGALWVGLENAGLDRLDPGKGVFSHHAPGGRGGRGHPPTSVTALIRDSSGRLWAGTRDAGLWRLDPGTEEFVAHSGGRGEPSPIGDSCVTALYEDGDGNIWAGTGGAGLVRLDPESGAFVHYGEDEGFYGDSVQAIVEDSAGILWIASSAGLYSFDRNLGDFFCFGAEDGLVPGSFSPGALARGADGRIWVGSSGGATVFDPVSVPRYAPQPEIAISGSVLGETAKKTLSGDASPVAIGYDNRGLEFSISVIDYTAPSRNRYAMKLDGKQESWTFLGRNNSAFLAPLAPGRYTLRVKGSNGNGIWNNYGASLSIVVASPFWATWWFRTLAAILLLAATSLGILARILALRKRNELLVKFSRHVEEAREEERRIAAREVHDEIGQHLTVLNFHAYWLASHPEARAAESAERVASIRKGIGEAMESVKSVATKLRPAVLDTLDFSGALRWYSGDFARLSGIEVALSVGDGVALPAGELATALFRVLQEMLGNVMRHSGAAQVRISFGEAEGAYLLEVGDDGAGMEPGRATRQDSFGIIGMKERCASFGGSLEISSAPGKGTTIRARIPKPAGGST